MKKTYTLLITLATTFSFQVMATPVLQMNKAFNALEDLIPVITDKDKFMEKKNEAMIKKDMSELNSAFKIAGHDSLIKHDLFAPSYAVVKNSVSESLSTFNKGKKDYSYWLMKETVSMCLDCHTRLPNSYSSSFQSGELSINYSKFKSFYDLGMAQMIVRRYEDAKMSFQRNIQDQLIAKNFSELLPPFQQILLIETKIKKDPEAMIAIIDDYLKKGTLPFSTKTTLVAWRKRLELWKKESSLKSGINSEKDLSRFFKERLDPLKKEDTFLEAFSVDLLMSSGLISNYFFENQNSPQAPMISYWLGWIEKRLKKEHFLSSGDVFLKQCVRLYPQSAIAKDCLNEYEESVVFDFSGSAGTIIPADIKKELKELSDLVNKNKVTR